MLRSFPRCEKYRRSYEEHGCLGNQPADTVLDRELFEWAKARTQAMQVDVSKLNENPTGTDTVLRPPWRTVVVPQSRIEALKTYHYYYCSPSIWMW
nr:hypothetical protein [Oxalobacteraceae bacterium]